MSRRFESFISGHYYKKSIEESTPPFKFHVSKWCLPLADKDLLQYFKFSQDKSEILDINLYPNIIDNWENQTLLLKKIFIEFLFLTGQEDGLFTVITNSFFNAEKYDFTLYSLFNKKFIVDVKTNRPSIKDLSTFNTTINVSYFFQSICKYWSEHPENKVFTKILNSKNHLTYIQTKYKFHYEKGFLLASPSNKPIVNWGRHTETPASFRLVFNKTSNKFSLYNLKTKKFCFKSNINFANLEELFKAIEKFNKKLSIYLLSNLKDLQDSTARITVNSLNKLINNPYFLDTNIPLTHTLKSNLFYSSLLKSQTAYKTGGTKAALSRFYSTSSNSLVNVLKDDKMSLNLNYYLLDSEDYKNLDINYKINFYKTFKKLSYSSQTRVTDLFQYFVTNKNTVYFFEALKIDFLYLVQQTIEQDSENMSLIQDCANYYRTYPQLRNIVNHSNYSRKNLKKLHDDLIKLEKNLKNKAITINLTDKEIALTYENGPFTLLPVNSTGTLVEVGQALNICVGAYKDIAIRKRCTIYVVYQYDVPVLCIESDSQGYFSQCKLAFNRRLATNTALADFMFEWQNNKQIEIKNFTPYDFSFLHEMQPKPVEITLKTNSVVEYAQQYFERVGVI